MQPSMFGVLLAASLLSTAALGAPTEPTMAQMQWHRRVLLVSTADADDPQFRAQQQALSEWTGGDDRDVTVVRVERNGVSGAHADAAELRRRYRLPARSFSVALIGKEGHVALRSSTALTAAQLQTAIDAMPMRKAGQR